MRKTIALATNTLTLANGTGANTTADLSGYLDDTTSSVIAGTGIDVSSIVTGDNTAYTVTVDGTDIIGDGNITSSDLTVGGDASALLGDVTLEIAAGAVGATELATGAVTSAKILDGTIATSDIADNAVTLGKLSDGTLLGQVMQWDGADWTLVDLGSVTVTENDGVIGNEVTGASNGTLTLSGSGSTASPLELAVTAGGITVTELADQAVTLSKLVNGANSGELMQWNGTSWVLIAPSSLVPATTVSNTSTTNTLTTTVDGVTGTGVDIINTNVLSLNASNELVSTVNGEASTALDISGLNTDTQDLSTTVVTANEVVRVSLVDGGSVDLNIEDADADATNEIQDLNFNTGTKTLTITNNSSATAIDLSGLVNTDAQTIALASNTLTLANGTGANTTADLSGYLDDTTSSVIAGTGIDVSSIVTGNNTAYTVTVDGTDIIGDGNITSSDLTVGGDASALLGDVTLEIAAGAVGATELATGAVTSAKILDGTIATSDIADNAVTLGKLSDGTLLGQVMQWDGADWTLVDLGSVTVTENDGVIGNEVTGASNGTLTLSGTGSTVSPLELAVTAGGITVTELADQAVTLSKLVNGANSGELMQWNGTSWVLIDGAGLSTDDQKIDVFSLAGTTISVSAEGDGEAVNLLSYLLRHLLLQKLI